MNQLFVLKNIRKPNSLPNIVGYGGTNESYDYAFDIFAEINKAVQEGVIQTSVLRYQAGAGCHVTATTNKVQFVKSAGIGNILVPADTELIKFTINGTTADLNGNTFTIRLNTIKFNNTINDFQAPLIQVINTTAQLLGPPSPTLPLIYNQGTTPQIKITAVSAGVLDVALEGLDLFSNWTIIGAY